MNKVVLVFCLSLLSIVGYSQKEYTQEQIQEIQDLNAQIEGTYQIQVIDSRKQPALPFELAKIVEEKRSQTETVYHYLDSNIRILILPENQMKRNKFTKDEKLIYISSK